MVWEQAGSIPVLAGMLKSFANAELVVAEGHVWAGQYDTKGELISAYRMPVNEFIALLWEKSSGKTD